MGEVKSRANGERCKDKLRRRAKGCAIWLEEIKVVGSARRESREAEILAAAIQNRDGNNNTG